MKCTYERDKTGRSGLQIHSYDPLDARPDVDFLYLDATPNAVNANYIAVATALAFGDYVDARLQLPYTGDPETVAAITDYLSDSAVSVTPVSEDAQIKSSGALGLYVSDGPVAQRVSNSNRRIHTVVLNLLPADKYFGRLATMSGIDVGSNAFNASAMDDGHPLNLKRGLAVALMYAAELQAGTILVPPRLADHDQLEKLRPMFDAVGLGLEIAVLDD
ncbi:hypothetical protein [Kocuria sp. SM24M-10]|uniref:hypothetical protein n=1 Tax=Kocuria sp. SM24M-10 TaxID=1660349 RepID=UPI000649AB5F|nr:hypothetical protein [Kocuria sp. SM24M-10]KLU10379.1 hypothetical protein ABL57_06780 [Kocuria sp. SM24M-10]